MLAFPGLILALFWVTLLQPGANTVTLAIAVTLVAPTTRVLRSSVLSIKEMTYVDGARAVGCSTPRILMHHIFPNITALYIILISLSIGNAIIVEASLTFLGLGIAPDIATWGNMVHRGTRNLFLVGWWLPVVPVGGHCAVRLRLQHAGGRAPGPLGPSPARNVGRGRASPAAGPSPAPLLSCPSP